MRRVFAIARDIIRLASHEKWLWGFLSIAILFLTMANMVFMMKQPMLENLTKLDASLQIGLVFINIFCMIIALLASLGILKEYLREDRLLLLFSKPIYPRELYWGIFLGLGLIILSIWIAMVLFLQLTILLHKHIFIEYLIAGFTPAIIIGIICISLVLFFYNFYPNGLSALFSFLIIVSSFGVSLSLSSDSFITGVWKEILYFESFLIPKINQLLGISMNWLKLFAIDINSSSIILHSFLFIIILNWINVIIFERKVKI